MEVNNDNRAQLTFLVIAFLLLSIIGIGIAYLEGYENGGMRVIELVGKSDKVEIHIIRIGETEIARDTIVTKGAGGISVVKGKFY